jgi:peptide/nickel transport system permease protein
MHEPGIEPAPDYLAAQAENELVSFPSHWRGALRAEAIIIALLILFLVVLAVFGQQLAPYNPTAPDPVNQFLPPSSAHLMGTDDLGRDVLSRVMVGTRYSLIAVVIVLTLALLVGTLVGSAAGYLGGLWDEGLMRVTDIFLAFPGIILALAVAAALGPSLVNGMIAISAIWWPTYARLVRGQVLSVKENQYVEAARVSGARGHRILAGHILPNSFAPVVVQLSLDMGNVLVTVAALSFIGLGAQLPTPEWGLMVSTDAQNVLNAWWQSTFPGLAIFLTALIFNIAGDIVQALLLPRTRQRI